MVQNQLKRVKSCFGKMKRSKEEAVEKAEFFGAPVIPYPCDFCSSWHVGHNVKEQSFYTNRQQWEKSVMEQCGYCAEFHTGQCPGEPS